MKVFLLSLVAPFVAVILAYLLLRSRAPKWPPDGAPPLPASLWLSTGIILLASGVVHWSLVAVRNDRPTQARIAMILAVLAGFGFLATQCVAWADLVEMHLLKDPELHMFSSTFYILTGLHGLHVLGGLVLVVIVAVRTFLGCYWSLHHPGVLYNTMYWHFIDGVWIVLFVVLELGLR